MVGWALSAESGLRNGDGNEEQGVRGGGVVGGTTGSRPWCDPVPSAHQTPRAANTNIAGQTREGEGGGRGHNRDDVIRRERRFFLDR